MRKLLLILFTLCISISCLLYSSPTYAAKVQGSVKNENGEPIIGATVICLSSNNSVLSATITDIDGNFSLDVPPFTEFRLQYSAVGYIPSTSGTTFVLQGDNVTLTVDVVLHEDPGSD